MQLKKREKKIDVTSTRELNFSFINKSMLDTYKINERKMKVSFDNVNVINRALSVFNPKR